MTKRTIPFALAIMMLSAMLSCPSALGIGLVTLNVSPQKQVYSVGETVTVSIPDNGYSQIAIYVVAPDSQYQTVNNGSAITLNQAGTWALRGYALTADGEKWYTPENVLLEVEGKQGGTGTVAPTVAPTAAPTEPPLPTVTEDKTIDWELDGLLKIAVPQSGSLYPREYYSIPLRIEDNTNRCDKYFLMIEDCNDKSSSSSIVLKKVDGKIVDSNGTIFSNSISPTVHSEINTHGLPCGTYRFYVAGFEGTSIIADDEVSFVWGGEEHQFSEEGICVRCWYDREGYHRYPDRIQAYEYSVQPDTIPKTLFDPSSIDHFYYLRSLFDASHTAIMLVDHNGNGLHLSYYGDGSSNSAIAATDLGIQFMSVAEVRRLYDYGDILYQISSEKAKEKYIPYYTYYDMIDCKSQFSNDEQQKIYKRFWKTFRTAVEQGYDYSLFSQNCDDIAHMVFYGEYSPSSIPAQTFQRICKEILMKEDKAAVYRMVDHIKEAETKHRNLIDPFIPID